MAVRVRGQEDSELTDAREIPGTKQVIQSREAQGEFGHVQFIPGQMSNGKWSFRLRSQEGDVGSQCNGGEDRGSGQEVKKKCGGEST